MNKAQIDRFRDAITDEEVSMLYSLLSRISVGYCSGSPAKTAAVRKNAEIALAVRQGRHEDADRLRWLYYPEKMRKKEIEAQLGKTAE